MQKTKKSQFTPHCQPWMNDADFTNLNDTKNLCNCSSSNSFKTISWKKDCKPAETNIHFFEGTITGFDWKNHKEGFADL